MKILVIGSGGREHAIISKLNESNRVKQVFCAPGNGGIEDISQCVDIKAENIEELLEFAIHNKIDLTIVGPEVPLSMGIVDIFRDKGLRIFGANRQGAELESSKVFSKDFMKKYNIPTAKYKVYDEYDKAVREVDSYGYPVVIKADGLAGGKGVLIADTKEQALRAIKNVLVEKRFGTAGNKIIIEEFLQGKEASILAFVDGKVAIPMVSAQDYKRIENGDKGLNTGGMGAVSPAFHYDEAIAQIVKDTIIDRTIEGLKTEGIDYRGVLYFGLMITDKGIKVLEYNVRFGDPETEVVLLRLDTDLVDIINAVIDKKLTNIKIQWKKESAVCVVLVSKGYPEQYQTGYKIKGLENTSKTVAVFHSGTKRIHKEYETAGGRVLVLSTLGDNVEIAREKVYNNIQKISFHKAYYRNDIGK